MSATSNETTRIEQNEQSLNFICKLPSGWVFLSNMQFLRGYCILQAYPVVESINILEPKQRSNFLCDMALIGDALLEVTKAYRINYALLGNSDPILHAHIVPRYRCEPKELRSGLPWSYPNTNDAGTAFSIKRDKELLHQLRDAIQCRTINQ
ncbi:MAG: hypothetical protein GYA52_03215 [Chloroflexi bacterium]|nr:hypothetical protein [Chloroflexota bacterium]